MSKDGKNPSRLEISLVNVPNSGILQVTFLADYRGLWTHFQRLPNDSGRAWHCAGSGACRSPVHKNGTTWKGYAPVQWLDTHDGTRWIPAVLEVTERMRIHLGDEPLRGTTWNLQRVPYRGKSKEISALLVREVDPRSLRSDVMIQPVVERLYRETELIWDRPPLYSAPQILEVQEIAPQIDVSRATTQATRGPMPFDPNSPKTFRDLLISRGEMLPPAEGEEDRK